MQLIDRGDILKRIKRTINSLQIRKEPTGFTEPENITVSYDSTSRKVTLSGTIEAYWRGILVRELIDGWESEAHENTEDTYYLYYDGSQVVWSTDIWEYSDLLIAIVYYTASDKIAFRECHGLMQWQAHEELHATVGTYRESGGDVSGYVLGSNTASERRPDVSACIIKDEDLKTTLPILNDGKYTHFYLSGASGDVNFDTDQNDILPLNTNQPYFNEFTGGSWQQTLMSNNKYMSVWLIAVPITNDSGSQKYRFLWMQGQSESSLSDQQALTPNSLETSELKEAFKEFVFIQKVIIKYQGGNWEWEETTRLIGSRQTQIEVSGGSYLSSVSVDSTLSGDGTASNPLSVVDHANFIRKNGSVAFTSNQSMGSNKLINLANGSSSGDAVNKGQLDGKADKISGGTEDNIVTIDGSENIKDSGLSYNQVTAVPKRFYQIDGDFNHWQNGNPGSVTTTSYFSDMFEFDVSTGAGTLTRITSPTTSKDYAINANITTLGAKINQGSYSSMFSEKKVSMFIYAKVTTGTADVSFGITTTGGGADTDSANQTLSDSYAWYRLDNDRSAIDDSSATVTDYFLELKSVAEYQIDKIRIIEQLPGNAGKEGDSGVVIPDWVKEDENKEAMLQRILQLFWSAESGSSTQNYFVGGVNITNLIDFFIPMSMIKEPSLFGTAEATSNGYIVRDINNTSYTGFTFSIIGFSYTMVRVRASKNSHGVTNPVLVFNRKTGLDARP